MKKSRILYKLLSYTLFFAVFSNTATAEYLFTAPPRETAEQGEQLYGQLVKELSRIMQGEVKYVHPKNWRAYKKQVQSGKFDFIFDGPHFAAWRLKNMNVAPLVKLPGTLSFVLVADKDNTMIINKDSLISRKICAIASPHLGTLSTYLMYPNQVRQPRFIASTGGFKNQMNAFKAGKCDAVVLREGFYRNKLDARTRNNLKVIAKSKALTNQGITINNRIDLEKQKEISAFLMSSEGKNAAKKLLNRFSKKRPNFISAKMADFDGHNLLKDNMIFGWK